MNEDSLGQRIRRLRVERGLSLAQVADQEFSRAFLHQVEMGKSNPSIRALRHIAERLDTTSDYLLGGEDRFARRRLLLESARLALAKGRPDRTLSTLEPLRDTEAWPLGTDVRLCIAAALIALGRGQEADRMLDAESQVVEASGDAWRREELAALRSGRSRPRSAAAHETAAAAAARRGDIESALEHLVTARVRRETLGIAEPGAAGPSRPRAGNEVEIDR
ncbi:MAG TPA: helix-turn-helix transcriptional regulator [Candidatus Dormibacteraeota bacterium]|nr:helix-turn-helix transcriptional regulator [Candidatus Dormibacteraeota bacterium]